MQLTPGTTINAGDSVWRQTIYNCLALAAGGVVHGSDLNEEVLALLSATNPPTPYPGLLWWDLGDQLMKVYVDVLDGTGVSVWLAIGPDRFDCACLADEPIPFGAAVMVAGTGNRRVKLPDDAITRAAKNWRTGMWDNFQVIGFNNQSPTLSHTTAASGTWFACADRRSREGLVSGRANGRRQSDL